MIDFPEFPPEELQPYKAPSPLQAGKVRKDVFAQWEARQRFLRASVQSTVVRRLDDCEWEAARQLEHDDIARFWNARGGFDWSLESVRRRDARRQLASVKVPTSFDTLTVADGGSLLQVKRARVQGGATKGGGKRGKVTEFSRESRMRILRLIASLKRQELPLFLTLTYHYDPGQTHKRHLDNLCKRLVRAFPKFSCIWRMEYQGRGVVHYHLLVWGVPLAWFMTKVGEAVSTNGKVGNVTRLADIWCRVSGQREDSDALLASVGAEAVRSINGVFRYAAKYITKPFETVDPKFDGRYWGAVGRLALPVAKLLRVILTRGGALTLARYARRFTAGRLRTGDKSFTLFCDARGWWDKILLVNGL